MRGPCLKLPHFPCAVQRQSYACERRAARVAIDSQPKAFRPHLKLLDRNRLGALNDQDVTLAPDRTHELGEVRIDMAINKRPDLFVREHALETEVASEP